MIKDKTIYFGYGTVSVGASGYTISFTTIKPPQEIGMEIKNKLSNGEVQEIGTTINLTLEYAEAEALKSMLDSISETNTSFVFKDYTFDFTNYNPKSVEVVKLCVKPILNNYLPLLAC